MAGIPRATLNRIPGGGMPLAAKEKYVKDLTKLTRAELMEIKDRESNLLANKMKRNRLPDKGQRIQNFYNKVLEELERRSNIDDAVAMFSELNIAEKGQKALNQLEWNHNMNGNTDLDPTDDVIDSDDETELDPLRLIAQRSMHERKTKVLPPEPTLITAEDLEDIKSFSSTDSGVTPDVIDANIVAMDVSEKLEALKPKLQEIMQKSVNIKSTQSAAAASPYMDAHVRYLIDMVELDRQLQREKFKPYQTTISNVHDPEKEKLRKKHKHWEVTAATPPLIQHGSAKLLNLLDSVDLQSSYLAKLKELQEKQAVERLAARIERLENINLDLPNASVLKSNTAFNVYRNPLNNIEGDQRLNETEEVNDPLDEERPGGAVTYTVFE